MNRRWPASVPSWPKWKGPLSVQVPVLNAAHVNAAAKAGAESIVSPGLSEVVVVTSQTLGLPVYPGISTASEVQSAWNMGLKTPGHQRFFQSVEFEATFGGGEANVAVVLANYGLDAVFVSALPENDIGEAAIRELRGFGVDVSGVRRSGDRVGIYYLETGANQRALPP